MALMLLAAAVWLLPCLHASQRFNSVAGPYTIEADQYFVCPKEEYSSGVHDMWVAGHLTYNKALKYKTFNGNATISHNIFHHQKTMLKVEVAKWDPVSGWRENYLVLRLGEACMAAETFGADLMVMFTKFVPGVPRRCPIPDGHYGIYDFPMQLKQLGRLPVLPYIRFKATILGYHLLQGTEKIKPRMCLQLLGDVLPKRS